MSEGLRRRRERFIYLRDLAALAGRAEITGPKSGSGEPPRPWIYLRVTR